MTLADFVAQGTGEFPKRGTIGTETDWLEIGTIDVPTGSLCAVDSMMLNEDDGVVIKVPPGAYVVEGKAMEFDGHIRVSRMRAYLEGTTPSSECQVGEAGTDSATMAICDIEDVYAEFDDSLSDELSDKLMDIDIEGGQIKTLYVGDCTMVFAVCESGLGDGGYPVFELRDGRRKVGIEVEFLPPGFVID